MEERPVSASPGVSLSGDMLFRNAFTYAGIGMALVGLDGRFLLVNPALCRITGYSAEELVGRTFQEITYGADLAADLYQANRLLAGVIESYQIEKRYVRSDGSLIWVCLNGSLVRDEAGAPLHFIAQIEDISARVAAEQALREREARLRAIWAATNDAMALSDSAGMVLEANSAYLELYGYTAEQVIGMPFTVIFPPEQHDWALREYYAAFEHAPPDVRFESQVIRRDGVKRIVESRATFLEEQGVRVAMLSTIRDITDWKELEQGLRASILEKEVLLKEVHHRVKNNLQVIISLLRLQAQQAADPHARDQFRDTQSRVRSMALVHELLYSTPDLSRISLAAYTQHLATGVLRSYTLHASPIHLTTSIPTDLELTIDIAVPLGLILTELLSNSLKYAFPDQRVGTIALTAERSSGRLLLRVADDGIGLSTGVEALSVPSLGLQLVRRLVLQLAGTVSVETSPGTTFVIDIPFWTGEPAQ